MAPTSNDIDDEASRWVIQQDLGPLSPEEKQELSAWLKADTTHEDAYRRAQKTWAAMSAPALTKKLVKQGQNSTVVTFPKTRPRFSLIKKSWIMGVAASLALGVYIDGPSALLWWEASATTRIGEIRTLTLADGSQIQMDSDSAIAVDYTDKQRAIRLLKGQAAFIVAHDAAHPFIVTAANGATTALGTRFIVRRDPILTNVTVTEHSVRVQTQGPRTPSETIVHEGESATYGPDGVSTPHPVDVDSLTAWTRGRLVFVDQPLQAVVNELARYHHGYITLVSADVGNLRVSGSFDATNPLAALDTLEHSMGLHITKITNALIFIRK
ncbi:MAG: FecR family protein [Acetobacter sp.]|uniref:FecR family protein n=1 Tax=Acetobacter sp. TaxID=440 RepID=UPI0039EA3C64